MQGNESISIKYYKVETGKYLHWLSQIAICYYTRNFQYSINFNIQT